MNEPTPSVQTNILSQSMRDNYNSLGVDEYYKQVRQRVSSLVMKFHRVRV